MLVINHLAAITDTHKFTREEIASYAQYVKNVGSNMLQAYDAQVPSMLEKVKYLTRST